MYMCVYIKWTMSMPVRIGYNTCYIFLKLSVTHWSHFRGELFCVQHTVFGILLNLLNVRKATMCYIIKSLF